MEIYTLYKYTNKSFTLLSVFVFEDPISYSRKNKQKSGNSSILHTKKEDKIESIAGNCV